MLFPACAPNQGVLEAADTTDAMTVQHTSLVEHAKNAEETNPTQQIRAERNLLLFPLFLSELGVADK